MEEKFEEMIKLNTLMEMIYKCRELVQENGIVGGARGNVDEALIEVENYIYNEIEKKKEEFINCPLKNESKTKMTNADKIRSMTDEELAEWLDRQHNQNRSDWEPLGCYKCIYYKTHHQPKDCRKCEWKNGILGWLKKEVQE